MPEQAWQPFAFPGCDVIKSPSGAFQLLVKQVKIGFESVVQLKKSEFSSLFLQSLIDCNSLQVMSNSTIFAT